MPARNKSGVRSTFTPGWSVIDPKGINYARGGVANGAGGFGDHACEAYRFCSSSLFAELSKAVNMPSQEVAICGLSV